MGSAPSEWPPGCEGALCHLQAREAGKSLLSLSLSFPVCKMGVRNITQSKKEGKSSTCYSVDGPGDIMLREVSQAQKDKYCAIPLIRGPWSCRIETESGMVGARGWGWRGWELVCCGDSLCECT